jgi:hypothetical protein
MFGPKSRAADVAVLLEEGLRNDTILLSHPEDAQERPRSRFFEKAADMREDETSGGSFAARAVAIGLAPLAIFVVLAVGVNYHRLADIISKFFERLR